MKNYIFFVFSLFIYFPIQAQHMDSAKDSLPYFNIPDYPIDFEPGSMVARMVDGLGYRYYWATEGLKESSLTYKPSDDSREIIQTIEHIKDLSETILNVSQGKPNVRGMADTTKLSYEDMRRMTLENVRDAANALRGKTAAELEALSIVFQRGDRTADFPFWHLLNGQLADAIYHTGQVVAFRRAAGNPVDPRMNVFTGKTRE